MEETLPRSLDEQRDWEVCPACRSLALRQAAHPQPRGLPGMRCASPAVQRTTGSGSLLDKGSIEVIDWPVDWLGDADPLNFVDTSAYPDRLAAARRSTGLDEAVVLVKGTVRDNPVVVAVMDFRFLGGSLGPRSARPSPRRPRSRLDEAYPLLLVTASGGARMQEGVLSLMQMAKTSQALGRAATRPGVLTISLITDPTYGGVAASFATLGDVIIAEPQAPGWASPGPRVIEQTIRQSCRRVPDRGVPAGARADRRRAATRADAARARWPAARCVRRPRRVGEPHPAGAVAAPAASDRRARPRRCCRSADRPGAVVGLARHTRPAHHAGLLSRALRRLRRAARRPARRRTARRSSAASRRLDGMPVVVIGHQKGHTTAELVRAQLRHAQPGGLPQGGRG